MLNNLFLLNLNESLESYIFNLIQSIKINKFDLLINDMTIVLIDYDKQSNSEKNFSFKSMITQLNDKKRKFKNNSEFQRELKKCTHCKQEDHSKQSCWLLHSKLHSDEWKSLQKRKNLIKEDDFKKSFKVRIVRTMKIFIIYWADSHTDVWWINIEAENHVCYDIDLFNKQSYQKIIDNSIVTANNETVLIIKKDSIMIDILLNNQSIKIQLINVYHCLELHYNLMSVDQMKVKEYTCSIKNNEFRFMNFKDVITLIDLRNNEKAYFMNTSINLFNSQVNLTSSSESVQTSWHQWHKWLTHLNMIDVKRLVNMNIDINVNSANSLEDEEFSESIYKTCVIDK